MVRYIQIRLKAPTWFTGSAVSAVAHGQADALTANRVAHGSRHGAHVVTVTWLTSMRGIGRTQVVGVSGASITLQSLYVVFTHALARGLVANIGAVHRAPGLTLARQTAQRVSAVQTVVSIPAHVTPLALCVRFALTLSGYRITGGTRNGSVWTAVAGQADSTAIQTVEVRDAGVTEEALYAIFALALAGERITELV